jgi:hypothetical protein
MYLAICLFAAVLIAAIILAVKLWSPAQLLLIMVGFLLFNIVTTITINIPSYPQARYCTEVVDGCFKKQIMFNNYSILSDGQELNIPSHYYIKNDWINRWEYCETSLVIECPGGKAFSYVYNRAPAAPYIKQGVIECK